MPSSFGPPRILIAEDHEGSRDFACAVLSEAGFDVVGAGDGEEALFAIAADPSIGLLVTDIMMPGTLDGWALARKAKALRPALRVVYMTAVAAMVPADQDGPGYGPLLPKPWTPEQLLGWVRRSLRLSPGPRVTHPRTPW